MSEGTVCITFDFDALSLWIARGLATPGPLSRGEFGAFAVPRLLRLLRRYDIKSTWFVPGHTIETYPALCQRINDEGHEIAMHGYMHEAVSTLSESGERDVLSRARDAITNLAGNGPTGNRTPSWDFTDNTVDLLLELGVRYDSSLMGTDYSPTYCRSGDKLNADGPYVFGEPTKLIELPVSWSLDDYPQFEYVRSSNFVMPGLRTPGEVFGNFLDDVRYMVRDVDDGICVLTFHPQVISRGHRLLGFEAFLDALTDLNVDYLRMDAVAHNIETGRKYGREKE